ncbi:Long-chain-fatty-acid--CoA ligase FadD17 [Rhodococcus sp. RD6.2]|uniref:long-chain-fatty-acid--CoA ligase n=1 Tax=Rhodococcus sp. RD6.2 TaxID=260936 RepID=UPI00063B5C11|nr:long-chain-fatty-acid--CoA ligase [Rhodococcus sp. RD6.2]CRK53359.1 Long-chain-fatty-acid--CoA ligase FadD17 [Rhodococcus sp. RD6.2]
MSISTPTVADLLMRLRGTESNGILFEDTRTPWSEHIDLAVDLAAAIGTLLDPARPSHVAVLLDNVPEFSLLLSASAIGGTVLAGLNTTRRGAALAGDVARADCQLLVTDSEKVSLLDGLDLDGVRVLLVDSDEWHDLLADHHGSAAPDRTPSPDDLFMLIFTSGTSGDPKAVRVTHKMVAGPGVMLAERFGLTDADTAYASMPMFHSGAVMACWAVALAAGANFALRRKFSASGFMPDVRRFGVTYAHYVGKPLAYVLATPERDDDADNPLKVLYGNEGSPSGIAEFARRFDVRVVDGFGSTEGGVLIPRAPGTPPGALGLLPAGIAVLDPDTGAPCPTAEFDESGHILNADKATGELVNTAGIGSFAGYYNNPEAEAERVRDGQYWSGDLGYVDADGYVYFAGRSSGWMRVDGENLGTSPIENIVSRHPHVVEVAAYAVPDPQVGDRVAVALVTSDGFDIDEFAGFLSQAPDLGPKQVPSFVRVTEDLPKTATYKVLGRSLSAQRWNSDDPTWFRASGSASFVPVTAELASRLNAELDR